MDLHVKTQQFVALQEGPRVVFELEGGEKRGPVGRVYSVAQYQLVVWPGAPSSVLILSSVFL